MMFKGFDLLTISFQSPLVLLLRKKSKFLLSLLVGIILFRFVFSNAGFEFPYQDESTGNPTPQRLFVTVKKRVGKVNRIGIKPPFIPQHTTRHFYDKSGGLKSSDSGFWMRELDINARKTIESLSAPGNPIVPDEAFCKDNVFCALPTFSCRQLHTGSFWLPASPPLIRKKAEWKLIKQEVVSDQVQRMTFHLSSKTH